MKSRPEVETVNKYHQLQSGQYNLMPVLF